MSNVVELKLIEDEVIALKASPLFAYRNENHYLPVLGEGSSTANLMFVGEAPGETEAKSGKPFCGRAGKVLDELLASIGMDRKTVFITNLVKDRPPGNRDPKPDEIALYGPFLDRQIEILKPRVIATLGRHSMEYIFTKYGLEKELEAISKIHGKEFTATTPYGSMTVVALYHPAFALYNGKMKASMIEDFKALKKYK